MAEPPATRTRGARSEQRLRTRNKVLAAARTIFGAGRYMTSTIDEIAQLAGVSRAGLYMHFKSKEAILAAVLSNQMDWYVRQYRLLTPQQAASEAGLVAWFRSFIDGFLASGEIMLLFRMGITVEAALKGEGRKRQEGVASLGDRIPAFRIVRSNGAIDKQRRLRLMIMCLQLEQVCLDIAFGLLADETDAALKLMAQDFLAFAAEP
jgi:AcrR family transcriptional regulator